MIIIPHAVIINHVLMVHKHTNLVSQSILLASGRSLYLAKIFLDNFGLANLNRNRKKRKLMHAAGKYLLSNSMYWMLDMMAAERHHSLGLQGTETVCSALWYRWLYRTYSSGCYHVITSHWHCVIYINTRYSDKVHWSRYQYKS